MLKGTKLILILTHTYQYPENHNHLRDIEITKIRCLEGFRNKIFIHFYEILKGNKIYFFPKIENKTSKTLYGSRIIDFSKYTNKPIDLNQNNQKIIEKLKLFLNFELFLNEYPKNEKN